MSERRDYRNLAAVFPYVPAYTRRLAELEAAGQYPYNDSFKGHIAPGLEGRDEDAAIYMLQSLRTVHEDANRVNAAWDEGFRPLDIALLDTTPRKVCSLVEFGWYMGGSGFRRCENVRLLRHGYSVAVMAKGQRTRGRIAEGELMVLDEVAS